MVWFTCIDVSSLGGRRKRWKGNVTFRREDKCLQSLVRKVEVKGPLERPYNRWEENMEMCLK